MTTPQFGVPSTGASQPGRWAQQAGTGGLPVVQGNNPGGWGNSSGLPAATVAPQAVPVQNPAMIYPGGVRPHKKALAALFAFLWSSVGAANFYLGYRKRGTAQLLTGSVGIFVCMMGPLVVVSSGDIEAIGRAVAPMTIGILMWSGVLVWGFVDVVMILMGAGIYRHDARGHDLV